MRVEMRKVHLQTGSIRVVNFWIDSVHATNINAEFHSSKLNGIDIQVERIDAANLRTSEANSAKVSV